MGDLFYIVSTIVKKFYWAYTKTDYSVILSLHCMKEAVFTVLNV